MISSFFCVCVAVCVVVCACLLLFCCLLLLFLLLLVLCCCFCVASGYVEEGDCALLYSDGFLDGALFFFMTFEAVHFIHAWFRRDL